MITLELDLQKSYAFRVDSDYSRVRFTRILYKYSISVDGTAGTCSRCIAIVVHVCVVCQPAAARGCPRYLLHRPTRLIVSCYCSPMAIFIRSLCSRPVAVIWYRFGSLGFSGVRPRYTDISLGPMVDSETLT